LHDRFLVLADETRQRVVNQPNAERRQPAPFAKAVGASVALGLRRTV